MSVYNYTTLDDPLAPVGPQGTAAKSINDAGQIVGDYTADEVIE
jgi:hypothetical protein